MIHPGLYRHFKGGAYVALTQAKDSRDLGEVVIYASAKDGGLWVRPMTEWHEPVVWPDGVTRPRFVLEASCQARL